MRQIIAIALIVSFMTACAARNPGGSGLSADALKEIKERDFCARAGGTKALFEYVKDLGIGLQNAINNPRVSELSNSAEETNALIDVAQMVYLSGYWADVRHPLLKACLAEKRTMVDTSYYVTRQDIRDRLDPK